MKKQYRITYPKNKVSQIKTLVSHHEYINIYIPMKAKIDELVSEAASLNKKKHQDKIAALHEEVNKIKSEMKKMFGSEFFTTESPLWKSRENNGIMVLPICQGGNIEVILEEI